MTTPQALALIFAPGFTILCWSVGIAFVRDWPDIKCRWRHTKHHYGVIPYATYRCRVCDDKAEG